MLRLEVANIATYGLKNSFFNGFKVVTFGFEKSFLLVVFVKLLHLLKDYSLFLGVVKWFAYSVHDFIYEFH